MNAQNLQPQSALPQINVPDNFDTIIGSVTKALSQMGSTYEAVLSQTLRDQERIKSLEARLAELEKKPARKGSPKPPAKTKGKA